MKSEPEGGPEAMMSKPIIVLDASAVDPEHELASKLKYTIEALLSDLLLPFVQCSADSMYGVQSVSVLLTKEPEHQKV